MSIRFCHPKNFERFIEYDKENHRFNGLMGDMITSLFYTATEISNLTVEVQADDIGVGVYREDLSRYDGCLGNIQMNHSDAVLQMNPYPIDIEGVSQGLIFYETSLMLLGAYDKAQIDGSAQLLKGFDSFSRGLWVLCMFTWFLMSMFLVVEETVYRLLRSSSARKRYNCFYQTSVHCTRFGAMDDGGLPRRLLYLSASLFALLVVHYFCSMIKTELVTIKDPQVFHSYDDIIERGAIPLFMRGQSYKDLFSGPDAEPYRKKLWNYAINTFGERRMYVDLSAASFLIMCISVTKQKVIILLDESLIHLVGSSGCSFTSRDLSRLPGLSRTVKNPQLLESMLSSVDASDSEKTSMLDYARENDLILYSQPEVLIHITRDAREKFYNQGLIYTSQNEWLKKHLEKWMRRMIEVGFVNKQIVDIQKVDLFENDPGVEAMLGPSIPSNRPAVERCKSKSIIKPTIELQAIKLANLVSLFILTGSLYFIFFVLLVCEVLWKKLVGSSTPRPSRRFARRTVCVNNEGRRGRRSTGNVAARGTAPARRHAKSAGFMLNAR